jgi:iron(III) transport system ATP-binding protein
MTAPLWKLEDVTLPGRAQPRLDGVTLTIDSGVTAVLGPSGAGKSTLLNLLAGFERPTSGTIDCLVAADGDRLPVFWAPADNGLWPHLTVAEHLHAVAAVSPRANGAVEKILAAFDLTDKSRARIDQLSQGERARLAVARGVAADPRVLVLDEPLVHVDPRRARRYWDVLRESRAGSSSLSVVFSTHLPDVALREADSVVCLDEGRVRFSGETRALYERAPTAELAWSLGPVNCVTAEETNIWMDRESPRDVMCRPEQLEIVAHDASPLIVNGSRHCGSVTEVELVDERSGRKHLFFARPRANIWRAGERVLLRIVALALCLIGLAGCSGASASPELTARRLETWSVPADGDSIPAPRAIHATPDGSIYVLDNAGRVLVYDHDGRVVRQWRMPEYSVGKPEKIVRLRDGSFAVADTHYHRVVFFDGDGQVVRMLGKFGRGSSEFVYPVAIAEDDEQNLYVCEYGDNDRIQKFDKQGNFLLAFGQPGTGPGDFQRPSGALWYNHRIYVVDAFNNRIQVFSDSGDFETILGGNDADLRYPYDIALGAGETLYVAEYGSGRVSKFDLTGKLLGRYGTTGFEKGQFNTPWGLTVDEQSRVFVADTGNRRIVAIEF